MIREKKNLQLNFLRLAVKGYVIISFVMANDRFELHDFTIGLVGGLLLGAVAGILLAPAAGDETRKAITQWTAGTTASASELIDQAKKAIEAASGKAEQYLGLQEKGIKKKLEEIRTELERYDLSGS